MGRVTGFIVGSFVLCVVAGCGDSKDAGERAAEQVWMRLGAQTGSAQLCVDLVQPGDKRDRIVTQLYGYDEISSLSDVDADAAVAQIVDLCDGLVNTP